MPINPSSPERCPRLRRWVPYLIMGTGSVTLAPPVAAVGPTTGVRRLVGGVVAVCAAGILGLAAYLEPSPTGLGTHAQLALPSCGWIALADIPCPTCGMTTAFAHAADGNLVAAAVAQPMGAVLAVAVAAALFIASYVAATGSRIAAMLPRLWGRVAAWALGAGFAGAWIYKVLSYKGWLG